MPNVVNQLKESLMPLYEEAFGPDFIAHKEMFDAAENVDNLQNVLKILDYCATHDYEWSYNESKKEIADTINFELEGFITRNQQPKTFWDSFFDWFKVKKTSWRIPVDDMYSFKNAWKGTGSLSAFPYSSYPPPSLDFEPHSAFKKLKESLIPLYEEAFGKDFIAHNDMFDAAKNVDALENVLKKLDYDARYHDLSYNESKKEKADAIYFKLEGFTRRGGQPKTWWDSFVDFFTVAKESWRIGSTYSKLSAEDEAASIQEKLEDTLIKSSPAKVSAPFAQASPHHIIAPRPVPQSIVGQHINFTPAEKGLPTVAAGSTQSFSERSNQKRSAPRGNPEPTNAATKFRSVLQKTEVPSPTSTSPRPLKVPTKH